MKLSWLASLGLLALGMGLIWYLHRRHERATRADYRDQLDAWYSDIPHISPLDLPTVKALKATKARRGMEIVAGRHAVAARGSDR